jgi:hypothetical protein
MLNLSREVGRVNSTRYRSEGSWSLIIKKEAQNSEETKTPLTGLDILFCFSAALISFLTYGIDKAILFVFLIYTAKIIWHGATKRVIILIVTTTLLLLAVMAQLFL